jgi:hypothetical protein
MSNNSANRLNDKYLRLYGIPISVVAFMFAQMPFFFPGRWDLLWKYTLISLVFTTLIWEIARWIMIRMRQRFPGLAQSKQRVSWTLFYFVVEMAIGQLILTKFIMYMGLAASLEYSFFQIWFINFACALFFIALIGTAYEAVYTFHQYKTTLVKAEHLKKQQAQQRLEALKTRVNPHFLFNALTTLSALIGEDAPRAERFVDELSKVYRYLLRAGRQPTVTLGEELQFADSYVFLLQNRFEAGTFSFKDNCRGNSKSLGQYELLDHTLPALVFQNALDYFVRTQNLPLHIQADIHGNELQITGKYQPKNRSMDVSYHDWAQLELLGARQEVISDQLVVFIPLTSNTLIS